MFYKNASSGIGEKEFNERFRRLGVLCVLKPRDGISNGRPLLGGNPIKQLDSVSRRRVVGLIDDAKDAFGGFNLSYHGANIRCRGDPFGDGIPCVFTPTGKGLEPLFGVAARRDRFRIAQS